VVNDRVSDGVNDSVNHLVNVSNSTVNKEPAMRKTRRHEPPSRIRYNEANPVIGVRVDRATYSRLLGLRATTGLSFGALFKDALGAVEKDVDQIRSRARDEGRVVGRKIGRNEGYKAGYTEAEAEYRVTFQCSGCDAKIPILAGSKMAAALTEALTERGWRHTSCPTLE